MRAADDAKTALARTEGVALDLAVVDLRLPGTSGWSLVDELRQRRPQVLIVVTSVLDAEKLLGPSAMGTTQEIRSVTTQGRPRQS